MVDAGQQTATPVPADMENAPGLGVQVARMAPISRERMQGTIGVDDQDCRLGRVRQLLGDAVRGDLCC
jgi:hypothetical protein